MRHIPFDELMTTKGPHASGAPGVDLTWVQGPTTNDELDVGVVRVAPGARTPEHVHDKGQVIVCVSGQGFVQRGDERVVVRQGDVVICPAGEQHVHGADGEHAWEHLTISTGTHGGPRP